MPDFPARGGATAAEVWGYATRDLNSDANNAIRDAILSDATKIPGANINATISSRSSHAAADIWGVATRELSADGGNVIRDAVLSDATKIAGGNIDAAITSRSTHAAADIWSVVTRQLTAITGTPRSDLMGEDASLEAGTGARKARIDNTPAYETAIETSIVMDGTEKTLVEKTDDKQGILEGYVDLTPMQAGDTIVIRQSMKVKAAGAYAKFAEETYTNVQTIPLLYIVTKATKTAVKVTAQQTAGTNRTLDVQFYRRLTV